MCEDGLDTIRRDYGRTCSASEVAEYFNVDPRTVKKYYHELGGVYLFGRLMFFEKRIREAIDAHQDREKRQDQMAGLREEKRPKETKTVPDPFRSLGVGGDDPQSPGKSKGADPHGIFG